MKGFDPSQPFEVLDAPPKEKPAFDPEKPFQPVAQKPAPAPAPASAKPAFDTTQPFTPATPEDLARDSNFDPTMHAAETGDVDTAFKVYQARKARTAGEKAMAGAEALGGVVAHPIDKLAMPVINFLSGFPQVALNTAQHAYYGLTGDDRAKTKQAEATLALQHGEESGKHMLDATVGNLAAGAAKLDDPDPARTAWRTDFIRRNPLRYTPDKIAAVQSQWATEDATERKARDEGIDRKVFEQRVQAARNQIQLSKGQPLDTGIISKIYQAGGQTPSGQVGPEALTAAGAPQADQGAVGRMAAATDPNNIALALAPGLPGAATIGGGATELAGKAIAGTGSAISATGRALSPLNMLRRFANPASIATDAAKEGGARGLQSIGRALAEQGKELRTGAPSSLTTSAATAAATGESAIGTNIARKVGDTVAHGAQTAAGMAPLNLALSEGDPKAFAELEAGAAAFGGTLNAFKRNRAMIVEGVRPHLRSEGARALAEAGEGNDPLAAKSAAYLFSLPEAARDHALEAIGALQGLPLAAKGGPTRAKVYVLSEPDYMAEQARIMNGEQAAMGGGRGFFYGADGAAYINGDFHAGLDPSELSHTIGHEFGGHAAINIMRAASDKGGALYQGLMDSAKAGLLKSDGTANPILKRFIDQYNLAFDPSGQTQHVDPNSREAIDEFISETAGQIMAHRGAGELAIPRNVQDRIADGIGRFMGKMVGIDSREVGTPTKFGREEVGQLTQAVQDTLAQIVGMKLREGGEIPEPAKTGTTRAAELRQILAKPRPPMEGPAADVVAWRNEQRATQRELTELGEEQGAAFPAAGAAPAAPSKPGLIISPDAVTKDAVSALGVMGIKPTQANALIRQANAAHGSPILDAAHLTNAAFRIHGGGTVKPGEFTAKPETPKEPVPLPLGERAIFKDEMGNSKVVTGESPDAPRVGDMVATREGEIRRVTRVLGDTIDTARPIDPLNARGTKTHKAGDFTVLTHDYAPADNGQNTAADVKKGMSGIARGATDALYDALFAKLQKGDLTEAGQPSSVLKKAKPLFDSGAIKTVQDLRDWAQAGQPSTYAPGSTTPTTAEPSPAGATSTPAGAVAPAKAPSEVRQPEGAPVAVGEAPASGLTVKPFAGGTFIIVDAAGKPVNKRTYTTESAAKTAIAKRGQKSTFGLPPSASGNDIIDVITNEIGGIHLGKMNPEEREHEFPHKGAWRNALVTDITSLTPDNVAAELLNSHGIGDGHAGTMFSMISEAIKARGQSRDQQAAETKRQSAEEKKSKQVTKSQADDIVKAAEEKATAAEKNPKTQAAKDRIRAAKVEAILDAIGTDDTGLHRMTDDLGNTKIAGDFDPENPLHRALVENLSAPDIERIGQLQQQKGSATYIRYRSAISSAEGEGGEGTMDTGMANRRAEYDVDPAQAREEGTIQHKVIIPIETSVSKNGGLVMRAFVPDNVLHNAESIFEGLKETGKPNPYGDTPTKQGKQLIKDAQVYTENHAHGYRGDGSGPIKQFPDSGLPSPDPDYKPVNIPKARFDILNMAMHNETAGKTAERVAEVAEKRQKIADAKTDKERARLQGMLDRAIARQRQSEEAYNLGEFNDRWVDHQSGETNQLRSELKAAGFDTGERFKSPFENLLPRHILEVSDAPIKLQEGDIPSVRPTGMDVDSREIVRSGRPNDKAVAAGFMPSDVVYRGTPTGDFKKGDETGTIWFTPDKEAAKTYSREGSSKASAPTVSAATLDIKNTFDLWNDLSGPPLGKRKLIKFLDESLPENSDLKARLSEISRDPEVVLFDLLRDQEVVSAIKNAGFDSIRIRDDNGISQHDSIGVFDQAQVSERPSFMPSEKDHPIYSTAKNSLEGLDPKDFVEIDGKFYDREAMKDLRAEHIESLKDDASGIRDEISGQRDYVKELRSDLAEFESTPKDEAELKDAEAELKAMREKLAAKRKEIQDVPKFMPAPDRRFSAKLHSGSNKDFTNKTDPERNERGPGKYWTDEKDAARYFSGKETDEGITTRDVTLDSPLNFLKDWRDTPEFEALKKLIPDLPNWSESKWNDIANPYAVLANSAGGKVKLASLLRDAGYDGIVDRGIGGFGDLPLQVVELPASDKSKGKRMVKICQLDEDGKITESEEEATPALVQELMRDKATYRGILDKLKSPK